MFKRLVLEKRHGRLGEEEILLAEHAKVLGIPIVYTYEKFVARRHFKFEEGDLVAGSVAFMNHAIGAHNYRMHPQRELCTYPPVLRDVMHRKILPIHNLAHARRLLATGGKCFIKPKQTKRFTGFVAEDPNDIRFNGAGGATEVHVTEVVTFVSEWRVYVVHGKIVDVRWASGDRKLLPDMVVIEASVNALYSSGRDVAGYAIDFGVLDSSETALVEMNDGYSIGAYDDIPAATYWEVIGARWTQIVGGSHV